MASLGILIQTKIKSNRDEWELKLEYRDLLSKYEGIKTTDEVLYEESNIEEAPPVDDDLRLAAQEVFDLKSID
jgi:hypothetical protein